MIPSENGRPVPFRSLALFVRAGALQLRRAACLVPVLMLAGCSSDVAGGTAEAAGGPGMGQEPPVDEPSEPTPDRLEFDPEETLTLSPRMEAEVELRAFPADRYRVRFSILPNEGDPTPHDASLDHGEVLTDSTGRASVRLIAPSTATTFTLRASVGSTSTTLAVSVSERGHAPLTVVPVYDGVREVSEWVASVRAGTHCSSVTGVPPLDGDLVVRAGAGEPLVIEDVPVGPSLAVTVRAGRYIGGCADVESLSADSETSVSVPMFDRPLQLQGIELPLRLGVEATGAAWDDLMQATKARILTTLRGNEATDDATALLDAMERLQGPTLSSGYRTARSERGWDALLRAAWLGESDPGRLLAPIAGWLDAGAARLLSENAFEGRLESVEGQPEKARLNLTAVSGVNAKNAGFAPTVLGTWAADPGDVLLFGAVLHFVPDQLLLELAAAAATEETATEDPFPGVWANAVGCAAVGELLAQTGDAPSEGFAECGAECLSASCEAALASIWQRTRAALLAPRTMSLSATGVASVDDEARPVAFNGSWRGRVEDGYAESSIAGPAAGGDDVE